MSAESISTSSTFGQRYSLVDSLVMRLAGGESRQDVDLEGDPFFDLEAWFLPEQSLKQYGPLPPEEELAERLHTAPQAILELVKRGLLSLEACVQVFTENDLTPPGTPSDCESTSGNLPLFLSLQTATAGQLAVSYTLSRHEAPFRPGTTA